MPETEQLENQGQEHEQQPPPQRPVPNNERPVDGPGSGRGAIRQSLEKARDEVREREEREQQQRGGQQQRGQRGQQPRGQGGRYQSRAHEMQGEEQGQGQQEGTEGEEQEQQPAEQAPEAFGNLRQSWGEVPEAWRQAIVKREQDMAQGVQAIQQRYRDLDGVLGPRAELMKRHGHTPAQAVNQLFSWFDALAQDPERIKQGQPPIAFIALAKSFGLDKMIEEAGRQGQQGQQGQNGQQQAAQNGQGGQPAGDVPPAIQQYINQLEGKLGQFSQLLNQRFGTLEQRLDQSSAEKTNEILAHWSQDKPHFEAVKMMMAHLLESGAVPPLEGGRADLDKAYEMAVYAVPEVRQKVLAEAEAKRQADEKAKRDAEQKAQQEQANRARRAAGGLAPGAPGDGGGGQQRQGQRQRGKSVRESLMDSINELSG